MKYIQFTFRIISVLAPKFAASMAFILFQRPRKAVSRIKVHEADFYRQSSGFYTSWSKEDIKCYEQGNPEHPLAILVHGWESNSGSLGQIAEQLRLSGYYVVSIDLPAHGQSKLKATNLIECREALRSVLCRLMPGSDTILVTHSFGSAVAAHALSDSIVRINKWVMITSPNQVQDIFETYRKLIGLGNKAYKLFVERAESILGESVQEVRVDIKLQEVKCSEILLLHDGKDKVLPIENSRMIAEHNRNAKLHTLENTGHYSMLYNPEVIQLISQFLNTPKTVILKPKSINDFVSQ